MSVPVPVEALPTGLLLQEYREALLRLGGDQRAARIVGTGGSEAALKRRADLLEAEVSRRLAW